MKGYRIVDLRRCCVYWFDIYHVLMSTRKWLKQMNLSVHVTALLIAGPCSGTGVQWKSRTEAKKLGPCCVFGRNRSSTLLLLRGKPKHRIQTNDLWYYQRKPGAIFLARFKAFLVKRGNLPRSRCIITRNTREFLF